MPVREILKFEVETTTIRNRVMTPLLLSDLVVLTCDFFHLEGFPFITRFTNYDCSVIIRS